jgi:hypothetical protein
MGVGAGWYYDSVDGDVTHQNLPESLANAAFSYYHGPYPTQQAAMAHTGVKGPNAVTNESLAAQAGTVAGGVVKTDIAGGLNIGTLMLRVGEVLLGLVLVGVGLAKLTGKENAISKVAATGAVGAML